VTLNILGTNLGSDGSLGPSGELRRTHDVLEARRYQLSLEET
jgi:hypothetical protein